MARKSRIAVIIPAKTCPCHQMARVFSQLGPEDCLIVVLNTAATDKSCPCRETSDPLVSWIKVGKPLGAGTARNLGVLSLEKPVKAILFCDADDHVGPTWLAELSAPLLKDSADLVGGALRVRNRPGFQSVVLPSVDYSYRQALFGGNMGMTYKTWRKLEGFNESFICCEDTDLAWRASELGFVIQVVPTAIVDYELKSGIDEFHQRYNWGKSAVQLLRVHGIGLDHLPGLWTLFIHKRKTAFAASSGIAALGQWVGQWIGRMQMFHGKRNADG